MNLCVSCDGIEFLKFSHQYTLKLNYCSISSDLNSKIKTCKNYKDELKTFPSNK